MRIQLAAVLLVSACAGPATKAEPAPVIDPGDGGSYAPTLRAADTVPVIDNPYLPLKPGAT